MVDARDTKLNYKFITVSFTFRVFRGLRDIHVFEVGVRNNTHAHIQIIRFIHVNYIIRRCSTSSLKRLRAIINAARSWSYMHVVNARGRESNFMYITTWRMRILISRLLFSSRTRDVNCALAPLSWPSSLSSLYICWALFALHIKNSARKCFAILSIYLAFLYCIMEHCKPFSSNIRKKI